MLDPYSFGSIAATNASNLAAEAGNKAEQADRHFRELESRFNRLLLVTEAMWSLLKAKTSVSETDLMARFCELELQQSKATVIQCQECSRTIPARRNRCLYCGHTEPVESIFQTL